VWTLAISKLIRTLLDIRGMPQHLARA